MVKVADFILATFPFRSTMAKDLSTVKDFYTIERESNSLVNYDENDFTKHFYKIPDDKRDVKVLHGEKTTSEMNKIVYYFAIPIESLTHYILCNIRTIYILLKSG